MNIDDSIKIFSKPDKSDAKQVYIEFDDICSQIKNKLTIKDILTRNGIDVGTGGNCMCPLGHTSVGGKCFSYTRNVWYCFHCHKTGNIFHLHMEINHTTFQNAKIALADMSGISDQINNEIVLKFQNKKKAAASELLARQFIKLYRVRAVRQDTSDEIYIYKEGIYVPEGKSYIREYVRSVLGLLYTETFANDVIDKIIVDSYIDKNRFFINERINLLPVANGILDLDTLELLDFSPQYIFFSKLPVIYDPLIKPEKTLQFIRDITKDDTDMITLQEIGGYLLYRESKFEKAFMFSGDGRNGKSKMLELYTNIIGEENVTAISLSSIELDSFSMSNLYGKYANFSADISEEALEGTGNFKQLVGRDNIDANRKFKSHITFTNFAKMIFSANKIPSTKDLSEGFFGRWIMVHFPYKFEDNPTEPHHKKRDIEIIEKISTPIELTGLLNWFIEGLKRILKNQKFTDNTSFNDIKTDWICASNTFAKFWLSEIEVTNNPSDIIKRDDMMEYYDDYCIKNKLEKADNKLIYQFSNQSCVYKRAGSGADKYMVYKKVKFKNPNLPPIDINNVPYIHDTGIKKEDEIVEKF
jgi:putative DNA primase/helicase